MNTEQQLPLPGIDPVRRVTIYRDDTPQNSREWDSLGTMVCWHSRYQLGDDQPSEDPQEFYDQLRKQGAVVLPLYLYDHSGITMRTSAFSCPWDSGQVGLIYVSREKIKAEYGWKVLTAKRRQKIMQYLDAEVRTYDQYLTGDVYGFTVEEHIDGEWEEVDSCWGFYGEDVESVHCYVEQYGFTKEQIKTAFADVGKPVTQE